MDSTQFLVSAKSRLAVMNCHQARRVSLVYFSGYVDSTQFLVLAKSRLAVMNCHQARHASLVYFSGWFVYGEICK